MNLQSAYISPSTRVVATEDLTRPNCPDCGSVLLIAEDSRFNVRGRIDHAWSCDDCGAEFVTSIRLRLRQDSIGIVRGPAALSG
jgi:RNase P subunit RPR2